MKAYLLARVSTEDQKDALPAQVIRLRDYASRQNYSYKLFELQESAYSGDRKAFRAIVDLIDSEDETVTVVFDKIDRLTRDPTSEEYIRLIRMCYAGRIELHFPSDSIVVSKNSPATIKMILNLGVGSAQYYSSSISDNVKRRQSQMLRDGIWTGSAPFGYRYVQKDGGKKWLEIEPIEARIVRETFEMYASGLTSMDKLVQYWKENYGIVAVRGRIEKLLKNPFYHGMMRWNETLYEHKYEKVISEDLFGKVQGVIKGYPTKPHRWAGLPYAYRGLIYCAECGCKITFEKKKGKYIYGHCTRAKYKHEISYVNENVLTQQFGEILSNIQIPDDVYEQILDELERLKLSSNARQETEKAQIHIEIGKYQNRLNRMYDDRLDNRITDEVYQEKYAEFTKTKSALEKRLQNIELLDNSRLDEYAHLLKLANEAPKLFKLASFEKKREIIKLTLSNLLLDMDKLGWKYKKPFDTMAFCNNTQSWQGH